MKDDELTTYKIDAKKGRTPEDSQKWEQEKRKTDERKERQSKGEKSKSNNLRDPRC